MLSVANTVGFLGGGGGGGGGGRALLEGRWGSPPPPQRPSYNSTRRHVRSPNTPTPTRVSNRQ